ncbi:flagellar protein FlgN [Bacillus sp. FJAT-47783]|uniref:flagellar protein FlgN n=1 Tax=Bacillus sp. FJAT-47783 TaxID=2922712 RepID=UPI001FAC9C5A|nr:flagellar protein FlgN [Bacillus sp. FJAT-47783]
MATSTFIQTMEKLYSLHEELYEIATKKTDVLKENRDVSELKELLKEEQLCLKKIQQTEAERMKLTDERLKGTEDKSLTALIERASGSEKEMLENLQVRFLEMMTKLKAVNELNQQLTHYALQYINLSLDMMMPQETTVTYSHPNQTKENRSQRSMFDSKA